MADLDWRGRPVLVTGAGGFIGSHLVARLLGSGARVRAMVHGDPRYRAGHLAIMAGGGLEVTGGDLRDAGFVRRAAEGMDTVFHLGAVTSVAYSYDHAEETIATNTLGTVNVCEACRVAKVRRLVHTSTAGVYGDARDGAPITEDHPLIAHNPYTAGKLGGDFAAQSIHLAHGLPVATIRLFNVYGPRMGRFLIMPAVIEQLLRGPVLRLGDLRPTRSCVYVDDIVDAFLRMATAEAAVGEVIHFGGGEAVSLVVLVERIAELMGMDYRIEQDPARVRPGKSEIFEQIVDCTKARHLLGWAAETGLDDGLSRTIGWFREQMPTST
jgi:dTDP-glucose 4,6-dehydratase